MNISQNIKLICVIGSGTMGNGIAHVMALHGFKTNVFDINVDQLEKAKQTIQNNLLRQVDKALITSEQMNDALSNLHFSDHLVESVQNADLVIEAASEIEAIKKNIFQQLDLYCKSSAILASNTSSISISALSLVTQRPEKVIGMHFMNPVPVMELVEIIKGKQTSDEVCATIVALTHYIEKKPVVVHDYPGFIANRILMPMINEAILSLEQGVAGVEEIDQIMKLGMAHPMGPLQLADYIGLDVCLSIMNVLHEGFKNDKYAPSDLLKKLVEAQHLGVKSKVGFYDYTLGLKQAKVATRFVRT
jgi:3-hydroxybutyryl-CoA dehydrogenase